MNVLNTDSGDVIEISIVHPVSSHRIERDILIEKGAFRDKDYRLEWNAEDPFLSIAKGDPESIWHWLDYCNGYQQSLKDCIRIRQNWLSTRSARIGYLHWTRMSYAISQNGSTSSLFQIDRMFRPCQTRLKS